MSLRGLAGPMCPRFTMHISTRSSLRSSCSPVPRLSPTVCVNCTRTWRDGPASARDSPERLEILGARLLDYLRRQLRARSLHVPVKRLQVVAHELLVEGGRAGAFAIGVRRPEARGVARQY